MDRHSSLFVLGISDEKRSFKTSQESLERYLKRNKSNVLLFSDFFVMLMLCPDHFVMDDMWLADVLLASLPPENQH